MSDNIFDEAKFRHLAFKKPPDCVPNTCWDTWYHTPTNALVYHIFKISLKSFTLKHSHCSDMFRQRIACHPQGALMILAKITINMNIPIM